MNEKAVIGGVLKAYDLMPTDKNRIGESIDMLLCPVDSQCGQTMVAGIEHTKNAITFERFVFEHVGYESEPDTAHRIARLKDRMWDLLCTLYYG